jgi:hypothetical protein
MRKRFWFGLVPLVCGLACLLNDAPAETRPAGPSCCEGGTKVAARQGGTWVCPIAFVAYHGSYCTYYAINCSTGQPCQLNSSCGLSMGNCSAPTDPPCTNAGTLAPKGAVAAGTEDKAKDHYTHKSLQGGVAKAPVMVNPIPKESRSFSRLVGAPMLVSFPVGKTTVKAVVYLVLVNPADAGKKGAPRIFGSGVQAITAEEPELKIPKEDVTIDNKVCTLRLGSVTYVVILHKDGKEAPAPKKG